MPGSPSEDVAEGTKLKWHQKFARQQFQGWRPILNVASAQIFFVSAGIFCISLGIPILTASLTVNQVSVTYSDQGDFQGLTPDQQQQLLWANADSGVPVTVQMQVDADMEPPIYMFYRLGSYFQNYRRYVRSYDSVKMHDGGEGAGASACDPFRYANFAANESLPNNGAILPCGQLANSFFNDSFTVQLTPEGAATPVDIILDESNLAWPSDRDHLYGPIYAENYNTDPDLRGGATTDKPLDESEHWMVWMRPGGSTYVTKLYGKINTRIPAGSVVTVNVASRYNTYEYQGSKSIILTTNSWVGGRNNFLGAAYIAVGALAFLVALAFFLAYNAGLVEKRQFGDLGQLSWLKKYDGSIRPAAPSSQRVQAQQVQGGQQPKT